MKLLFLLFITDIKYYEMLHSDIYDFYVTYVICNNVAYLYVIMRGIKWIFFESEILPVTFAYVRRKIMRIYLREKASCENRRKIKTSFKSNGQVITSTWNDNLFVLFFTSHITDNENKAESAWVHLSNWNDALLTRALLRTIIWNTLARRAAGNRRLSRIQWMNLFASFARALDLSSSMFQSREPLFPLIRSRDWI